MREVFAGDFVDDVLDRATDSLLDECVARQPPADVLHRAARDAILRADPEHDAVNETERVLQHQALELRVVAAAPVGTVEEAPADLQRSLLRCAVGKLEA